jgi:hypothetical protein
MATKTVNKIIKTEQRIRSAIKFGLEKSGVTSLNPVSILKLIIYLIKNSDPS